jgi:phosphatidylethanolamine/phosphatidyl-N-methylethanolamine N-methyltransferase
VSSPASPHNSWLYGPLARFYDPVFRSVFEARHRLALRAIDLPPGARVLDVGIGTGVSLTAYSHSTYVVGIDISSSMLAQARSKVRAFGCDHVSLSLMDACRLGLAGNSFDLVLSAFVASVVPDRGAYFAELKRVCKPGGVICVINHVHFRKQPFAWLEERLDPLTRRLGWHADLTLEDIFAGLSPGDISVKSLWPNDPWPVVICRTPRAS